MKKAVWVAAGLSLLLWSLLAWGAHLLLAGSGDWFGVLSSRVVSDAAWDAWLASAFTWAERAGLVAVWTVYGMGVVGLLSCAGVATLALQLLQDTSLDGARGPQPG